MKAAAFYSLLLASTAAWASSYKVYVALTEDVRVQLSDGAVWQMDKGDVFPVEAYKNQQKHVILKLGGATFMTETAKTRVLKAEEIENGLEVYRKNLRAYLDSTSKKITNALVAHEEEKAKEKAAQPAATPAPKAQP
jgi:ferric-dicitrate binding protein FerR (iron transport regulator)